MVELDKQGVESVTRLAGSVDHDGAIKSGLREFLDRPDGGKMPPMTASEKTNT